MVGSIERINQDIATLDRTVVAIAEELHSAYQNYLTLLGQAVSQQLILASYHVCTQGYPEQFLQLSYNQRYELQQSLRNLGKQLQNDLLARLEKPGIPDADEDDRSVEALPPHSDLAEIDLDESDSEFLALASEEMTAGTAESRPTQLMPQHLIRWQQQVEQEIATELRVGSHAANRLMQQAGILPKKLPEPVLEVAAKAEGAERVGGTPNLLNLLIEAESRQPGEKPESEESGKPTVMHIIAIHLRLAEIEFAAPTVAAARTQVRSLLARLKTLAREYKKKHRERAIAEAQAAWRASWTED